MGSLIKLFSLGVLGDDIVYGKPKSNEKDEQYADKEKKELREKL